VAKFAAAGLSGALTTTIKTALGIQQPASTLKGRLEMYMLVLSSAATPADSAIEWIVQKTSTAGTSTAVTATDVDDASNTPVAVAGQTFTAEPTAVANTILLDIGLNQRSPYTIVLGQGYEWPVANTASRGISIGAKHPSATPTVIATGYWRE
jgi:hypothetical protein